MWRARRVPGVISVGSRARGALGKIPGRGSRFGHSGHVATRATSGETLPAVVLGTHGDSGDIRRNSPGWATQDTCHSRRLPRKVSLAGLRGALGSFREGCGALGGFRGGLWRTRRLPGLALGGGFGTRG